MAERYIASPGNPMLKSANWRQDESPSPSTYTPPGDVHCVQVDLYGDNVIQPWCRKAVVMMPDCDGLHVNVHGNFPRYHPDTDSFDFPLATYQDKAELILY